MNLNKLCLFVSIVCLFFPYTLVLPKDFVALIIVCNLINYLLLIIFLSLHLSAIARLLHSSILFQY